MNKMEKPLMTWGKENIEKNIWVNIKNGYWGIKVNQKIYNKFKSPDIIKVSKVCRLEGLGHVVWGGGVSGRQTEGGR